MDQPDITITIAARPGRGKTLVAEKLRRVLMVHDIEVDAQDEDSLIVREMSDDDLDARLSALGLIQQRRVKIQPVQTAREAAQG